MNLVVVESPYAQNIARNTKYARACMRDCFRRGEAPFASHLLYTQVTSEHIVQERDFGIAAGLLWAACAEKSVVYLDFGMSWGMKLGIVDAIKCGRAIEARVLLAMNQPVADFMNRVLAEPGASVAGEVCGHECNFPQLDEPKNLVQFWRCACTKRHEDGPRPSAESNDAIFSRNPFLDRARHLPWSEEAD